MRRARAARLGLALALTAAGAASAYIPSVGSLFRKAAERSREGGRSREATLAGLLRIGDAAPVQATLVLRFPLGCRLDAPGAGAISVQGDSSRPSADARGAGPALDLLKLACPLIAYRNLGATEANRSLRAAATAGGVELVAGSGLVRLYDRAAYVIGQDSRDLKHPQLWLYKDNYAPARFVAQHDGKLVDLRLLQYGNPAAADWFPRVLELWQGDKLAARFEVLETTGMRDTPEGAVENSDDE